MSLQAACDTSPEVVTGSQVDVLSGAAPLHAAAAAGQAEAVSLLLQHGAPVDGQDGQGNSAIQACNPSHPDSAPHSSALDLRAGSAGDECCTSGSNACHRPAKDDKMQVLAAASPSEWASLLIARLLAALSTEVLARQEKRVDGCSWWQMMWQEMIQEGVSLCIST